MTGLTHLDDAGNAHMVDVGGKPDTTRTATATGYITMSADAVAAIHAGAAKKGDVLAVARVAGIMAAKRTSDLIPLCHAVALSAVTVDLILTDTAVVASATVRTMGPTGVEMEALTAVSTALLTVYDMVKAVDRNLCIAGIRLLTKSGGRSGSWSASGARDVTP